MRTIERNEKRSRVDRHLDGSQAHGGYDLVCLSHLRWDFAYQRPQHLLSRCAAGHRVLFVEEPMRGGLLPRIECSPRDCGVTVVVPHIPHYLRAAEAEAVSRCLIDRLIETHDVSSYVLWYYTPMALAFTDHLAPLARVYDCMDELSAFRGAPAGLLERERELLSRADLVFAGGRSLYEAKRPMCPTAHLFPSSIDTAHFHQARVPQPDPPEQAALGRPRLGYFGVIDERIDLDLLAGIAELRPDYELVLIGPVAKIDVRSLPRRPNIHYLGAKPYSELPRYLAGWDVALMPFAHNQATRYISPTKTPEYLAAGRPVIATSIRDVVEPYGVQQLVTIADCPEEFVVAVENELRGARRAPWLQRVDQFLAGMSWDRTWRQMDALVSAAVLANASPTQRKE